MNVNSELYSYIAYKCTLLQQNTDKCTMAPWKNDELAEKQPQCHKVTEVIVSYILLALDCKTVHEEKINNHRCELFT